MILLEEIGRAVAPVPVLPTLVEAALPIAAFGSDAQKKRWLPAVAAGDAILTAALAEGPGATRDREEGRRGLPAHRPPPARARRARRGGDRWCPRSSAAATRSSWSTRDAAGVSLERAETTDEQIRPHL